MNTNFKNLSEFTSTFSDEKNCRQYFEQVRFKDGDYCPHCGHAKIQRFSDGIRYRCAECRKDFTIKTGTLFGESKISLRKWFIAIYLLTTSKKGISSIELAEQVGTTQKTAWFMDHRIREALKQNNGKLFGKVEVDETYLGGKHRRRDGFRKKTAIMGMTQRGGDIKAYQIPNRETHTIFNKIKENVSKDAFLMTDEASVYKKLPKFGYRRGGVKHSQKEYVRGDIHTNSIESFWALFKRGYHGTYHYMSGKHLQRYIDEFTFRFNSRADNLQEKFTEVVNRMAGCDKLSYNELICKRDDENKADQANGTNPLMPPSMRYLVPSPILNTGTKKQ